MVLKYFTRAVKGKKMIQNEPNQSQDILPATDGPI